ncbi:MAG: EF-hand domain-containing protein [Paracoccaceae bacterium]
MSKKSETLEIRMSHEQKTELAALSRARGASMSEVVRDVIDQELQGPPQTLNGDLNMPRSRLFHFGTSAVLYMLPILLLTALYWSSAQSPAGATSSARIFFAELDHDGDGVITETEYHQFLVQEEAMWGPEDCDAEAELCSTQAIAAEEMKRIDADADGFVAYREFEAFLTAETAAEFLAFDLDRNGFMSADEFVAGEIEWWMADPEQDELLPQECIAMMNAKRVAGIARACLADQEIRTAMAGFDVNFDGRVSLTEFLRH